MATPYDFDGYEDYDSTGLLREHTRIHGTPTIGTTGARNSGQALNCGYGTYACRSLTANLATVAVGDWFTLWTPTGATYVYDFRDETLSHVVIAVNADGSISALRAGAIASYPLQDYGNCAGLTTLGTSATGVITSGVAVNLQVLVVISATVGQVLVTVNGTAVLNLTNIDTLNSGAAYVTNLLMGDMNATGGSVSFDDYWAADANLGDVRVDYHYPTGDGSYHQSTPSAGSGRWAMVGEHPEPDDDVTYNSFAVGNLDTYTHTAFVNTGASILGVLTVLDASKASAGTAQMKQACLRSGTNYENPAFSLSSSYDRYKRVMVVDPATSVAWTETNFNSGQFGAHRTA